MKIAVMMRAMDQDSGFRGYIEGLIEHMLALDPAHEFLLYYRTRRFLGRFASRPHVRERLLRAPHKLLWDQVAVPYAAWRQGAEVIFNPKFTVPFVSPCPVVMGLQEPAWWVEPQYYERFDRFMIRTLLPFYCKKSVHLLPMTQFDLDETRKCLGLPLENATVTYTCPGTHMRPVTDREALARFRAEYRLPERFLVALTRVDHVGLDGYERLGFYGGKNPEVILRAFVLCRGEIPHDLVFAGRSVRDYLIHLGFSAEDFRRVHFIDFAPYAELPKLYCSAEISLMTAYYDGCSTIQMESMACGCPVIASKTGASQEIGGEAALYVDPRDPADVAQKITLLAKHVELREQLSEKGLSRAKRFDWRETARTTLDCLLRSGRQPRV